VLLLLGEGVVVYTASQSGIKLFIFTILTNLL